MNIKQKAGDLVLLLQESRKAKVIAGALGLVVVLLFLTAPDGNRRPRKVKQQPQGTGAINKDEAYGDLVQAFKSDLEAIRAGVTENKSDIAEIQQNVDEYEERTAEIFKKILERIENQNAGVPIPANQGGYPGAVNPGDLGGIPGSGGIMPTGLGDGFPSEPDKLESFGDLETPQVAPPPPPPRKKVAFIGPADTVRVKLLAGVNAPTDGTPYPVIFKLVGDVTGPDGSSLPLGEARIIAAAQGSLIDQRALFRLTTLSYRLPSGARGVVDIDGYIVGEDGIRGMQGLLIDPIGKAIAGAGFAGGLSGLGQALSAGQINTVLDRNGNAFQNVNGDTLTFAAGQAVSSAADEWKEIIVERLNQLVPAVTVFSGREATAVFARPVTITDLFDELDSEYDIYSPLD